MASSNFRVLRYIPRNQFQLNHIQTVQLDLLPGDLPIPSDKGYWWVVEDEPSHTVAFACLKVCKGTAYGYLARSGVYENHRGKGLQRKLIRVREAYARKLGLTHMVCDTSRANLASSNSLIACGYKLYTPLQPWAFADGNYWIRKL